MNTKLKIVLFGGAVLVAVSVIIGLVVHRVYTRDRRCVNGGDVYYEDPITREGECIRSGSKGPCGDLMVLKEDRKNDTGVGVCQCDVDHNERTMIYHPDTNQCYFIFTQAFCEDGKWLTIKKHQGPICDSRMCENPDEVPLKDSRCVKLGAYDKVTCNKSQHIVRFHRAKIYPSCSPPLGTSIGSVGVPSTDCPEGYFSTEVGHCQPDFDFD